MSFVCDYATSVWSSREKVDFRDALLHSILLVGENLALRHDDVKNIDIGHVTVHPGILIIVSIVLAIIHNIKNSVNPREYKVLKWPGNTKLRSSLICCPFTALLSWMFIRGTRPGFPFSSVTEKNMIRTDQARRIKDFTNFFRKRLRTCGVEAGDVQIFSGHSLKKGCIPL